MSGITLRSMLGAGLALGLAAGGCTRSDEAADQALQDTAAAVAPAPAMPAGPSDAGIAHIVVTANTIDIEAGKLATEKGRNPQVTAFAQRMVTDHTGVNQQATQLAQRLNVTPADNATSQSLEAGANENMQNLRGLSGAAFDRAYIDHEVAYHQQVIDALDSTLIPSAQNPDLKALLQQSRPAFVAHLEMARQIQSSLSQ